MPDETNPAPNREPIPTPPTGRPPVPGWLFVLFGFSLVPIGALFGPTSNNQTDAGRVFIGGLIGLSLGLPMIGGLALASRFVSNPKGRFALGCLFGILILILLAGVFFAGCMIVMFPGGHL